MRRIGIVLLALLMAVAADAQRKKVGLVLSGGGAKGVAHIGVLKVLEEAGIPIDPDRIIITEYSYLGGKDAADKILEGCGQCNGMILMDQMVANGAEHQLQTQGVRVPQDISMIVYDSEDCAINFHFTTVNLQLREMGRQSLNTLYKLIHDGRSTVDNVCIDVKMILRESTTILR